MPTAQMPRCLCRAKHSTADGRCHKLTRAINFSFCPQCMAQGPGNPVHAPNMNERELSFYNIYTPAAKRP
jgi:hypothetical protein